MAECGLCRDCKWWQTIPTQVRWGRCFQCFQFSWRRGMPEPPGSLAKVGGGNGFTSADTFGCVQWEARS